MKRSKLFMIIVALVLVAGLTASMASAQATTKSLATNFTLVNLSPNDTEATVNYYLPDGSAWKAPDVIPILGNGGQAIVRQYTDPDLPDGMGSVVVTSLEPLAGLVQIVIDPSAGQTPTSAAYTAISEGGTTFYVPQVAKNGSSATGIANSVIIVQNLGAATVDVDISLTKYGETTPIVESITDIAIGASYYYEMNLDDDLSNGFYSAVVEVVGDGSVGVVANTFFGADGLMSVNAFPAEALTSGWSIPLVFSRLSNSLVTSLIFQNLSGEIIPAGDINLYCTPDPGSGDQSTLDLYNPSDIAVNGIVAWNTLTQTGLFPTNWYGPCTVTSATDKGIVGIVQYRFSANQNMSAYEAIPSTSIDTTVFVPLGAKTLTNKFCTAITVMNLSDADITADLIWTGSGAAADFLEEDVAITANGSIIRNLCLPTHPIGVAMPAGWVGTLTAEGTGPIAAFVQNRYNPATGDQFMAYLGITQP